MEPQGTAVPHAPGPECPAARGSASLEGPRWHPPGLPAGDDAAALVPLGAGIMGAPLLAQHPSSGVPRRVPHRPPSTFPCAGPPWGCAVAAGRATEGTSLWGWHSGDPPGAACWQAAPVPAAQSPFSWAGRALPGCPSPPGYRDAAHPTPGVQLPGDARGFPPRASSQILP